ncbi:hypothetical protein CCMSSC00406_0001289 [Pleurotus cornucopiae]|uniref:Uncharacterized protein n=1 Tax=Pleurotus cornucopiae TaxID=5321 RepID=A0ACB7IK69_PLECO|nr:hypothetical protein CCMSSC00406_0001289 [Pleurotus cornucopiae]
MTLMAGLESSMSSPYVSLSHFRLDLECQYWRHWEHFANIQVVTDEIYDELMNLLLYDIVVQHTDHHSNAYTFSLDELHSFVRSMKATRRKDFSYAPFVKDDLMRAKAFKTRDLREAPPSSVGGINLSYMLEDLPCTTDQGPERRQFSTYWGENFARTGRDQWMREHSYTLFLWAVSPWFFGAPNALLRGLDDIFINKQVAIEPWRQFMRNLHAEWQDFILNSAVLLAANVAFLAIQSIDGNKDRPEFRSPPQIASYVSTLMSISSIFAGLLLVHNTREKVQDSILEAVSLSLFELPETSSSDVRALEVPLPSRSS